MSMDEFVQTLSEEQKAALIKALGGNTEVESRWQHEEPISEAVDGVAKEEPKPSKQRETEDFTMRKEGNSGLPSSSRREPVRARKNTWVDTGSEAKDVTTPEVSRTPRNRKPPQKSKLLATHVVKNLK